MPALRDRMLSVIMPAYNESEHLNDTIEQVVGVLERGGFKHEVIVVNDGSEDDTWDKTLSLAKRRSTVKPHGYKQNMGKGYALKHGLEYVQGDLVLFLDGDSDLAPSQIPEFIEHIDRHGVDVVIGSKRHPLSKVEMSDIRRFLSKGYSTLIRLMFRLNVTDTQVGLKLFKRDVLEQVFPRVFVQRYAFDVELLAVARRMGYGIVEAPVELSCRLKSGISLKEVFRMFFDTIRIFSRIHFIDRQYKV